MLNVYFKVYNQFYKFIKSIWPRYTLGEVFPWPFCLALLPLSWSWNYKEFAKYHNVCTTFCFIGDVQYPSCHWVRGEIPQKQPFFFPRAFLGYILGILWAYLRNIFGIICSYYLSIFYMSLSESIYLKESANCLFAWSVRRRQTLEDKSNFKLCHHSDFPNFDVMITSSKSHWTSSIMTHHHHHHCFCQHDPSDSS